LRTRFKRIFGPKKEDMAEGWRRVHTKEPHNLYTSPYITRVIKSRKMRWAKQAACMGDKKCIQNFDQKI
jgi:hypothetical protein